jgi:tryptophan synthase beta chain
MSAKLRYTPGGVPKSFYNIVPFLEQDLHLSVPPCLDSQTKQPMSLDKLAAILPLEMARQELNDGEYCRRLYLDIPERVIELYELYRPTPLVRAYKLEQALGLRNVRLLYKREDANGIGSYKLNSSYVQAFYAKQQGVNEFIGDTGPGNWGMGMAVACREFGIPAVIYMERRNYDQKIDKVHMMERYGARVVPITTEQGTIASSISVAIEHVRSDPNNRLSLGCLTAYSALHNTIIGLELKKQLKDQQVHPDVMVSVCGGGSSFSGFVFPFIESHSARTEFLAVESASVPSFTTGVYRYENPDLIGLMPRTKMYTLGVNFVPEEFVAGGLNYHGKNPLLSLLVHERIVRPVCYPHADVEYCQDLLARTEGVRPAPESCYAVHGAIQRARELDGQNKTVVFLLTGNAHSLEH